MGKQNISVQVNLASFAHGIPGVSDRQAYIKALQAELASAADYADDYMVEAVCLTGCAPLQYPVEALTNIIETLKKNISFQKNVEITLDALPGSVTYADLRPLSEHGVNRIHFDMQSFVPSELDALGRTYSNRAIEVFMRMVQLKMVFFNYDITLCYGLPGQTLESWLYSIEQAMKFMGMHITLLPVEGSESSNLIPFYQEAVRAIGLTNYQQYTPLHFARPGYTSLWNKLTYSNQSCLGFGVDAVSTIDGMHCQNTADTQAYMAAADNPADMIVKLEPITPRRVSTNVLLDHLFNLKASDLTDCSADLQEPIGSLHERGLLAVEGDRVTLTESGKAHWRTIAAELAV